MLYFLALVAASLAALAVGVFWSRRADAAHAARLRLRDLALGPEVVLEDGKLVDR